MRTGSTGADGSAGHCVRWSSERRRSWDEDLTAGFRGREAAGRVIGLAALSHPLYIANRTLIPSALAKKGSGNTEADDLVTDTRSEPVAGSRAQVVWVVGVPGPTAQNVTRIVVRPTGRRPAHAPHPD
jgi:hypothetical protein